MFDVSIPNNSHELYSSAQTSDAGEDLFATRPWVQHYEQGVPTHIERELQVRSSS